MADRLLVETGDLLLLEDGAGYLLLEDGRVQLSIPSQVWGAIPVVSSPTPTSAGQPNRKIEIRAVNMPAAAVADSANTWTCVLEDADTGALLAATTWTGGFVGRDGAFVAPMLRVLTDVPRRLRVRVSSPQSVQCGVEVTD